MRRRLVLALTSMIILTGIASTPAAAGCSGFGCKLLQGVPVLGPAAEEIDNGIRGVKDNYGSDVDVVHQATGGFQSFNNPIGRPAGSPAPATTPPMGNFCATGSGVYGPGPLNPLGSPCHVDFPQGVIWGRVVLQ
jgi:hypothetical protein